MKKITFMLMTAFIAVAAMAAGPLKRGMQTLDANVVTVSQVKQKTPKAKAVRNLQTPDANKMMQSAQTTMKKARKKAGIMDFLSVQWMLCSDYFEYNSEAGMLEPCTIASGGTPISFTMTGEISLVINGFTSDATEAIAASFSVVTDPELLAAGIVAEVSIPTGQKLLDTDYGPICLYNASAQEENAPITAYFYQDGYIAFKDIWACIIGGDGSYAGYLWTDYCESMAVPVNGSMSWGEGEDATVVPVAILQNPQSPQYASIYNFAGFETAVTATMDEDKSFAIYEQPIFYYDGEYGYFYVSGVENYYIQTLKGTGTENALTFGGDWMFYSPTKLAIYQIYSPATITLAVGEFLYPVIEEVAAVPADPEILAVNNYDASKGYGYITFSIPTVDTEEKDLKKSNLYYQLYSDIGGEIQPITFTPGIYEKLTEEMSIIPYGFTDDYDFADYGSYKAIFLNYNFNAMYDRIGVKSIYIAGGETNESEIVWEEIEKPEPVILGGTFNFNEMDVPTSSSVTADGDITTPTSLSAGNVILTISPKEEGATTENRFWSTTKGPQLRVYSGTLTFSVPAGNAITEIKFNYGKYNAGNTATPGALTDDSENRVATWLPADGEAPTQTVVIGIAGNTQINSIEVAVEEAEISYDLVTLPEGVEPEVWTIEGTFADGYSSVDEQRATEVAFDGTDIYVKGISYFFPTAWMKGSIDAETGLATFPSGQFVGEDEYGLEFMIGSDDGQTICDIVFEYDAEAKTLTQVTGYIIENADTYTEISYYGYWYDMYIYAGEPVKEEPVSAPEDLQTETYLFSALALTEGEEGMEDYTYQTQVGFDGQDVYFKGFSEDTKDYWAKGTLSEDGKTVTIPANQYLGKLEFWGYEFKYYLTSVDEAGNFVDIVLNYDAAAQTFATNQPIILNDNKKTLYPYQTFTNVVITKMVEFAATPADPEITDFKPTGSYPLIKYNIPTTDVNGKDLFSTKLFYVVWIEKDGVEQQLTLTTDLYTKLSAEMTEIPYTFSDNWDIYNDVLYLNQGEEEIATWKKIGIQSIYYGGGECNKSNIVWKENATGITSIKDAEKDAVIYNLAGQRVQKAQNGLYIINGKKILR